MFPYCHSNGFSDIYKGNSGGGSGEKVCQMDVSGVAFDNHPGGVGTNTRPDKRGWRAWQRSAIGYGIHRNVEASEAMRVSLEYSFWATKGDITFSSYKNHKDENPNHPGYDYNGEPLKTEYYISKAGNMEFSLSWDKNKKELVRGGTHIIFVKQKCDRLLLAQNVKMPVGYHEIDLSHATVDWYEPRKLQLPGKFDPNEDTDVRPYRTPLASVKGWEPNELVLDPNPDVPYYSTTPGGPIVNPQYIRVEHPPFGCDDWGDWRFNPKKTSDIDWDGRGIDWFENEIDIVAQAAIRHDLTMEEMYGPNNPTHRPAAGFGAAWSDSDANIMLYGWAKNPKPNKENPEYYEYTPIYWKKGPYATNPPLWNDLPDRLIGNPLFNNGAIPPVLKVKTDLYGHTHDFRVDIDLNYAFDLRLYCRRFDCVGLPLKDHPDQQNHPGEKIPDRGKSLIRVFLGTKCWASVRQISPTHPRT